MALVIDLKPGEKIMIGEAVVTNDSQRTRLHIAGDAPIMREKDIMQEAEANTPSKKVYFLVQCMYISETPKDLNEAYFKLVSEIQAAAASTTILFMQINDHIAGGHYYKALRVAKDLINHEEELVNNVR